MALTLEASAAGWIDQIVEYAARGEKMPQM